LKACDLFKRLSDVGNGIRESVINKIFQPFFTTKPTGRGTGWGYHLIMTPPKQGAENSQAH
jgi:C4-dicarboxylate-specific signal transduction histidine kinase